MARITRDIKTLSKAVAGLTLDVASASVSVLAGTATLLRDGVAATNKENLQNVITYTCDVVAGNTIGTTNKTLEAAINDGDVGAKVANYVLEAVHGNAEYRAAVSEINTKIENAESELDVLLQQAELATLEVEAQREIKRLEAKSEAQAQS